MWIEELLGDVSVDGRLIEVERLLGLSQTNPIILGP